MKEERENTSSSIDLSANGGIPRLSFGATGDRGVRLTPEEFKISGNEFTAYYDGAHKLVFVLDNTLDSRKPNVLLVINPIGDRKWDDILANDFGVDLETVRPKIDNKYQKLDIEYSGLSVYNNLINAHNSGDGMDVAMAELSNFRTATVRRAATDRLTAAEESIVKTADTISKTGETMRELQSHLKTSREKLARQKKEVGREPTKQSAAKILKTESQIDNTNEKLKRAKKRLNSAQRRLAAAKEDAEIARRILNQKENYIEIKKEEPKAKIMAEEVKPLFDKDPEIMDEKIAFKPIDFSAPVTEPEPVFAPIPTPVSVPVNDVPPAPLSFEPEPMPVYTAPIAPAPVLDTITTVAAPEPIVAPVVDVMPAPVVRPVSPVAGVRPVSPNDDGARRRPAMLYYIMLVALIILSIFTLWLYQKNTPTNTTPNVTVPTPVVESVAPVEMVESPFIQTEPAPVAVEQPIVIEEQPVTIEPIPAPEPTPAPAPVIQPEPAYVEPAPSPAPAPVFVNKPAYDVGTDKGFVADQNYNNPDNYVSDADYYDDGTGADQQTDNYESYESYNETY